MLNSTESNNFLRISLVSVLVLIYTEESQLKKSQGLDQDRN